MSEAAAETAQPVKSGLCHFRCPCGAEAKGADYSEMNAWLGQQGWAVIRWGRTEHTSGSWRLVCDKCVVKAGWVAEIAA